ncbi:MAG: hypothetical protein BWX64_02792 [Acidobacteria bacterium ADurb.Bin051]|nr:MAG: hypothetical protein BWX64_02792 [Acidobacteria bacterium ADurb.Bin051]
MSARRPASTFARARPKLAATSGSAEPTTALTSRASGSTTRRNGSWTSSECSSACASGRQVTSGSAACSVFTTSWSVPIRPSGVS